MNKVVLAMCLGSIVTGCSNQRVSFIDSKDAYFGLTPPGLIPEVFAPEIVSDTSWAEHSQVAISPLGDEIFWSAWSSKYPNAEGTANTEQIYFSHFEDGSWTAPALADFVKDHLTLINGGPSFSPDGNRLYFYSVDRPGGLGSMDTWYVEKSAGTWSDPINVGEPYNSVEADWSPVFTTLGNAYKNFRETVRYTYEQGLFTGPDSMEIYHTVAPRFPVHFSPDEQYVIMASVTDDCYGGLDLYVSFKDENDEWGAPINMGNQINTEHTERFPVISPDGKYLFFMRHTETQDFFWVSTDVIEGLKPSSE